MEPDEGLAARDLAEWANQNMLKGNFKAKGEVLKEEAPADPKAEYRKKALESVGGSMVFVERELLTYDPDEIR